MTVLENPETGNPKDVTQHEPTHRHSMDPLREAGLQDLAVETFLVTRKFSSTIFCWNGLHKLQEGESKNTKDKSWLLHFDVFGKGLSPTFYSHKGAY